MAVVIETTLGDLTVDLFLDRRPQTCLNFLKLCKLKYYNFNLFHTIQSNFLAQTGDPTGEGSGGMSVWGILDGPEKRFFSGEKQPKIRHTDIGLLSMVGTGDMIGSQFFFTLGENLDSLDGSHCVIGIVTEGHEVLRKLNEVICDETHRPYQDVRITHTVVLEDPFDDPKGLIVPSRSPSPSAARLAGGRLAPDEEIDESKGKSAAEIQELIAEREAKARATILEIVGDLPDADVAPPENVLFVCKLNPVTTDDDLELIFSRFGTINCCEVIRDKKTGNSLQYAFIEFAEQKSCEEAYFKMDNVLIDDRRIHVDFSQSVSKVKWLGKGRGVKHMHENSRNTEVNESSRSRKSYSRDRERESHKVMSHHKDRNTKEHKSDHKTSRDHEHKGRQKDKDHRDKHFDTNSRKNEEKHSKSDKNNEVGESKSERSMRHEKEYRKRFARDNSLERSRHHKNDEFEKVSSRHKNDSCDRKYVEENEKDLGKKYKHQNKDKSIEKIKNNKYDESEKNSLHHKNESYKKKYQDEVECYATDLPQKKRLRKDSDASNCDKNKYGETSRRSNDKRKRSHDSHADNSERYLQNKNNHENGKTSKDRENRRDVSSSKSRRHEKSSKKSIVIEDKYKLKGKRLQTPRTPSPDLEKRMKDLKESKKSRKEAKDRSRKQHSKKRRRSPSSDSSDSSSTSSSSSDGRKKKAITKKKKRKYTSSSSSSTSSDSSSSSSSDSDSSSSSTSSSDSSPKRKKKNKKVTKVVKKSRK